MFRPFVFLFNGLSVLTAMVTYCMSVSNLFFLESKEIVICHIGFFLYRTNISFLVIVTTLMHTIYRFQKLTVCAKFKLLIAFNEKQNKCQTGRVDNHKT